MESAPLGSGESLTPGPSIPSWGQRTATPSLRRASPTPPLRPRWGTGWVCCSVWMRAHSTSSTTDKILELRLIMCVQRLCCQLCPFETRCEFDCHSLHLLTPNGIQRLSDSSPLVLPLSSSAREPNIPNYHTNLISLEELFNLSSLTFCVHTIMSCTYVITA